MHVLSQSARLRICAIAIALSSLAGGTIADDTSSDEITRERVVEEINRRRAEFGLQPLRADERLHWAAEDRIRDMVQIGYWGHEPPEGGSPFVWLEKRSYVHRVAGENLAAGYETATLLVDSWMESPGHRANILSPEFEDVGVAFIDGGTTGRRTGRSVVVLFASELKEAEAPPG